jgi:hypothetical protein
LAVRQQQGCHHHRIQLWQRSHLIYLWNHAHILLEECRLRLEWRSRRIEQLARRHAACCNPLCCCKRVGCGRRCGASTSLRCQRPTRDGCCRHGERTRRALAVVAVAATCLILAEWVRQGGTHR